MAERHTEGGFWDKANTPPTPPSPERLAEIRRIADQCRACHLGDSLCDGVTHYELDELLTHIDVQARNNDVAQAVMRGMSDEARDLRGECHARNDAILALRALAWDGWERARWEEAYGRDQCERANLAETMCRALEDTGALDRLIAIAALQNENRDLRCQLDAERARVHLLQHECLRLTDRALDEVYTNSPALPPDAPGETTEDAHCEEWRHRFDPPDGLASRSERGDSGVATPRAMRGLLSQADSLPPPDAPGETKTLPCPFCGTEPILRPANPGVGDSRLAVVCMNDECVAQPSTVYDSRRVAIGRWNHRASPSSPLPPSEAPAGERPLTDGEMGALRNLAYQATDPFAAVWVQRLLARYDQDATLREQEREEWDMREKAARAEEQQAAREHHKKWLDTELVVARSRLAAAERVVEAADAIAQWYATIPGDLRIKTADELIRADWVRETLFAALARALNVQQKET